MIYGMRQKLTLVRKSDNDAIIRGSAVAAGKVNLTKVAWMMPRVIPNDDSKTELNQLVEDGAQIKTHRVILVSTTLFFKEILTRNKRLQPLLYMRGLKAVELVAMVDGDVKSWQDC